MAGTGGEGLGAVLGIPHFRWLYGTRLLSQAADGVFEASLAGFLVFSPERRPTAAAIASGVAVLLLPYSLVGPVAGVLIDRLARQRVLLWANALRAVLVAAVALLMAGGQTGAMFFVAALAVFSVNRFVLAALSAAVPVLVADRQLVLANSLTTTTGTMATFLGLGAGAGLRAATGATDAGVAAVALTAGGVYLLSAGAAARIPRRALGPTTTRPPGSATREVGRALRDVVAGARHVLHRRPAAYALAAITAHRFCYGVTTVSAVLLYRNYFTGGTLLPGGLAGLAQLVTAAAVGTFLGAAVTPAAARRWGVEGWVVRAFLLAAVATVGLGLPFRRGPLLLAGVVLGFVAQASKICVDTLVQEHVDDLFRGRAFSFYDQLFNLSYVASTAVAALVLPANGRSAAVVLAVAAGYLLTAGGYAGAVRRIRRRAADPVGFPVQPGGRSPRPAAQR